MLSLSKEYAPQIGTRPEVFSGTAGQWHILPRWGCHPDTDCHSPKAVKGA